MSKRRQKAANNGAQPAVKPTLTTAVDEQTDYSRWRLLDDRGRQTWHYLKTDKETEEWPQSTADKYHLGLPTVCMLFVSTNQFRASPILFCFAEL